MSDPNFAEEAGDFATDATVDTAVDGFLNQTIDDVVSHIPGGQIFDQALKTGIDQDVNNAINNELNKGSEGILQDIEGLFGRSQD